MHSLLCWSKERVLMRTSEKYCNGSWGPGRGFARVLFKSIMMEKARLLWEPYVCTISQSYTASCRYPVARSALVFRENILQGCKPTSIGHSEIGLEMAPWIIHTLEVEDPMILAHLLHDLSLGCWSPLELHVHVHTHLPAVPTYMHIYIYTYIHTCGYVLAASLSLSPQCVHVF